MYTSFPAQEATRSIRTQFAYDVFLDLTFPKAISFPGNRNLNASAFAKLREFFISRKALLHAVFAPAKCCKGKGSSSSFDYPELFIHNFYFHLLFTFFALLSVAMSAFDIKVGNPTRSRKSLFDLLVEFFEKIYKTYSTDAFWRLFFFFICASNQITILVYPLNDDY
uniref:Uncharacterized protein n=1 Tax=Glossina pallidipes TaxID=7398 RepID=A0A1B0AHI1_GLOPL